MKILFTIYRMSQQHSNYFDMTDPSVGETLILDKFIDFPRCRKQLTSPMDFSQLQYDDIELEISLLDKKKSTGNKTITQFFEYFYSEDPSYPEKKCLVIVDSGKQKWVGFLHSENNFDFSYANKKDGFVLSLKAFGAMVEWKKYAETIAPGYWFQPNTTFKYFLKDRLMNPNFFMNFINDVDPAAIVGAPCILNVWLHTWCSVGGYNSNYTIYNIIKGLAVEWGLVFRFEVPADYEAQALSGNRVFLTFRLMRRTNGNRVTVKLKDYHRTTLPRCDKNYILLINRKCNISLNLNGDSVNAEIVHGILISKTTSYNIDAYNMYVQGRHGFPDNCIIMSANSRNNPDGFNEYYGGKIIVRQNDIDVLKLNPNDVKIVENELFKLNLFGGGGGGQTYSLKFQNERVYMDQPAIQRSNSCITATRLFCSSYVDNNDVGIDDGMSDLNKLPEAELQVLFKNRPSMKGTISILKSEPDMFDNFIVPYKGVNEVHSIIRLDADYNLNHGSDSMTAEYQTVMIGTE